MDDRLSHDEQMMPKGQKNGRIKAQNREKINKDRIHKRFFKDDAPTNEKVRKLMDPEESAHELPADEPGVDSRAFSRVSGQGRGDSASAATGLRAAASEGRPPSGTAQFGDESAGMQS